MQTRKNFYENLTPFREFSEISDNKFFSQAPEDWNVLLADLKGSTKAIEEGRYKQVNLIGAATITCVLNALKGEEIPFVFGGDGSTMLVSGEHVSKIKKELASLRMLAQRDFALDLLIGFVPLKVLKDQGYDLFVGKYELSPGNYTAQFKGGALTQAEVLIKSKHPSVHMFVSDDSSAERPELMGLSCRLRPIEARNDVILSLLVKPADAKDATNVLEKVLKHLKEILGEDINASSPVTLGKLRWMWPPSTIKSEVFLQRGKKSIFHQWISSLLGTFISFFLLSFNIRAGSFDPKKYKAEIILNSDSKKFDDVLRMIIDCTLDQANTIEMKLRDLQNKGEVFFGCHRSSQALMTCMVESASNNKHIHFIDGADGGYALAAVMLKSAMKA